MSPSKHKLYSASAITVATLIAGSVWTGCLAPGEVNVYKAVPMNTGAEPASGTSVLLLRPRGFSVADEAFKLRGISGESDAVGLETIGSALNQVIADAHSAQLAAMARGELASPDAKKIEEIAHRARKLTNEVTKLNSNDTKLAEERRINNLLGLVYETELFLEDLGFNIKDVSEAYDQRRRSAPDFSMLFSVMGQPLVAGRDWETAYDEVSKRSYTRLNRESFATKFRAFSGNWNQYRTSQKDASTDQVTAENVEALEFLLFAVIEDALNLSLELRFRDPSESKSGKMFIRKSGTDEFREYPPGYVMERLSLNVQKARSVAADVRRSVESAITSESLLPQTLLRREVEALAENLADLTERRTFRRLQPLTRNAGTYLTFVLKTLYVSRLGHGNWAPGQKELLVTCGVKHANNAQDLVYPVIFEQDFSAPAFINRHDRILYGPAPYDGTMFNIDFNVVELDNLNNQAIRSGFSALVGTVSTMNPEFSAFAPAVNALFSSILETATDADREVDVSFTLPQPEGKGFPDTDFLIAETGHYILIKTESSDRKGVGAKAKTRQLYRRLIYNREDGLLYHRKHFGNPKENFTRDNLFLDQTYAVVVITDEYTKPDNLGDQLRRQVADSLGAARANQFIPDESHARAMIQEFKSYADTNSRPTLTVENVDSLKFELWTPVSDLRKQMIAEILFQRAEPDTKLLLGVDAEKWKRATVTVTNGLVRAQPAAAATVPIPTVDSK